MNMAHVPHQHFAVAYKVDAAAASVLYSELKQEVVCVKVSPRQMSFLSYAFPPFHWQVIDDTNTSGLGLWSSPTSQVRSLIAYRDATCHMTGTSLT